MILKTTTEEAWIMRDGCPLGSVLGFKLGSLLGVTVGYMKTVRVDGSTLDAPICSKNALRLTGTLGRAVGALVGASLGAVLEDGDVVWISFFTLIGCSKLSNDWEGGDTWLGSKSCSIRDMKSVLSMPNKGSSIGHELLHVNQGFQYV